MRVVPLTAVPVPFTSLTPNNSGPLSPFVTLPLQLVNRIYPGLREPELRYTTDLLAACLPFNTASYTEEDLGFAIRQVRTWPGAASSHADIQTQTVYTRLMFE